MGKSTEDSLAEIQKFISTGHTSETENTGVAPATVEDGELSKQSKELQAMMERTGVAKKGEKLFTAHVVNKDGVDISKVGASASKPRTETVTVTETNYHIEGTKKDGLIASDNIKFGKPAMTSDGSDFLKAYKDKEAAKFKPQENGKYR